MKATRGFRRYRAFTYDVEAMELELEQGELEIEKFNNDIDSMQKTDHAA